MPSTLRARLARKRRRCRKRANVAAACARGSRKSAKYNAAHRQRHARERRTKVKVRRNSEEELQALRHGALAGANRRPGYNGCRAEW